MKKLLKALLCFLLIFSIVGCAKDKKTENKKEITKEKTETYLVVTINPKLMLHLDKDGKIVEIFQLNDDAKIFLNVDFKDLDLDTAINKIVEVATKNGYLKDSKKLVVSILDDGENTYLEKAVQTFESKGVKVEKTELKDTEQKEILEVKEDYVEKKNEEKPTEKKEQTTKQKQQENPTPKADYNLNNNLKFKEWLFLDGFLGVHPQNPECFKKSPSEINTGEETYDSYCKNKVPTFQNISGKGYYCKYQGTSTGNGVTISGEYECTGLAEIASAANITNKIKNTKNVANFIAIGGGGGDSPHTVTLNEALCKKYQLSCARW